MNELRFDGRVAVITGAGRGVGRSHALLLASRGAKVVVADVGANLAGTGTDAAPADDVVAEITAAGGEAVACFASVAEQAGAESIIDTAITSYGGIDVVINNAGISDKHPFEQLTLAQFHRMIDVHYFGTLYVTKAAWPHLIRSGTGRVVNTTSEAVLGIIEQLTSYGAAKGAVFALTRNLAAEGIHHGIHVNAVAPRAATRMFTEGRTAFEPGSATARRYEEVAARLDPDLVAPPAAFLAHESCELNGEVLVAGGGDVQRMAVSLSRGISNPALTIENVADRVDAILDMDDAQVVLSGRWAS